MLKDPLFIISLIGLFYVLGSWMRSVLQEDEIKKIFSIDISFLSTFFGLLMLVSIFRTSGDLGIILLVGSIVALFSMIFGYVVKNQVIIKSSRGYFFPIFLIFILRAFIYEPYQIPSGSMLPGLKVGDFILVNKHSYGIKVIRDKGPFAFSKDPDYGDVVVFIPPHRKVPYVKRLIGKPGDKVTYINKKLYINGEPVSSEFIKRESGFDYFYESIGSKKLISRVNAKDSLGFLDVFDEKVPDNMYVVIGDNRDNSSDSRVWGFVPRDNFMGTADYIWMSWECWTCLPNFKRAGKIN
jgi:signal peptidase I